MSRTRWPALLAAAVSLVFVAGFHAHGPLEIPDDRRLNPTPVDDSPGSVSSPAGSSELSFTAVETARAPILVRSESRPSVGALSTTLLAVAFTVAALGRRGPRLGRVVELSIRSQNQWWRPAPGGRAPPGALTV